MSGSSCVFRDATIKMINRFTVKMLKLHFLYWQKNNYKCLINLIWYFLFSNCIKNIVRLMTECFFTHRLVVNELTEFLKLWSLDTVSTEPRSRRDLSDVTREGGGANLGQPANHLAVAPADGLGEEAAQTASIGNQLQPNACREKKKNYRGEEGQLTWGMTSSPAQSHLSLKGCSGDFQHLL